MNSIFSIGDIVETTNGVLKQGAASTLVEGVVIDSRKAKPGDFFVAIRGESFDGHWFVEEVFRAGGIGALIEPEIIIFELPLLPPNFAVIEARNTLQALQAIAAAHRAKLKMRTVGITGSNGKTSVKDFMVCIAAERFKTASTAGNYNNHIGVPLSVLSARAETEIGIFEMGMNHAGELAPLIEILRPDIGVITNIGLAHVEHLGSREAICEEKLSLARALPDSGTLVYDVEDDFAGKIERSGTMKKIGIGFEKGDLRASSIELTPDGAAFDMTDGKGTAPVRLNAYGRHMVRNALLASAACTALGMTLEECARGLSKAQTPKGRMQKKQVMGVTIFDDTYNANPHSVEAAIDLLVKTECKGKRIAVLGTMGELGVFAEEGHRRIGKACGAAKVSLVIAVGKSAGWIAEAAKSAGVRNVQTAETPEAAVDLLRASVQVGDVMLVKGSRASQMEKVIEGLTS